MLKRPWSRDKEVYDTFGYPKQPSEATDLVLPGVGWAWKLEPLAAVRL